MYLGEKEEGRFGRDRVAGHARSIVVTLGDYSRLWRVNCCFVVSSYTVCNTRVSANVHIVGQRAVNYGDYTRDSILTLLRSIQSHVIPW